MADKSKKPAVFDIEKPGKTGASATSRPIIVNQDSETKDPMVSPAKQSAPEKPAEPEQDENPVSQKESLMSHKGLTIQPDSTPAVEESEPEESGPEEVLDDEPKTEPSAEPEKSEEVKEKPEQSSENAEVSAVAQQVESKKAQKDSEEEIAKRKALQELIDSKKYFVPIKQTRGRRSVRIALILIVIIALGSVGFYFDMNNR